MKIRKRINIAIVIVFMLALAIASAFLLFAFSRSPVEKNPPTDISGKDNNVEPAPAGDYLNVKVTLGSPEHLFDPLLGGVIWTASRASAKAEAKALAFFKQDVLLDIKETAAGFGYRFDLNTFEPNTAEYGYYSHNGTDAGEPTNLDDIFQIFGAPNDRFILHVPVPNESLKLGAERFSWQTAEFYGAELQYLFGTADGPEVYSKLPSTMDFFAAGVSPNFNFANLRARRGHPLPYKAEAVIFGEEPYAIEGWSASDGASFGVRVKEYLAQMRARGVTLPYGIHVSQLPPSNRSWFKPLMAALPKNDLPKYIDLYHYYSFTTNEDWLRSFPVAERAEGFTDWWPTHDPWRADYTKFLWIIEDTKLALKDLGINPDSIKIGFSEHGITITSPFLYNDMTGGIHFALWLSEIMRYGTDWDSMWVLFGEGFSTAQVQYRDGALIKTPAFFAYQLAGEFKGLTYIDTKTDSPEGKTVNPEGLAVTFPYVVVRAFKKDDSTRELFVINQSSAKSARLSGLEGWHVGSWEQLKGDSFASGNPLDASGAMPVQTKTLRTTPDMQLIIPPVSVNRIVLTK